MNDRLPYTLTKGVTAAREGLVVRTGWIQNAIDPLHKHGGAAYPRVDTSGWLYSWPDAAERLRYREGDPWCGLTESDDYEWTMWCEIGLPNAHGREYALHRLAAILCDDAEALQVLHWCVKNLGGEEVGR